MPDLLSRQARLSADVLSGYCGVVLNGIETIAVTVIAHRLDSFRGVEVRARRQWRSALEQRGDGRVDAGFELVDSHPDPVLVDQVVYEFAGLALDSQAVTTVVETDV